MATQLLKDLLKSVATSAIQKNCVFYNLFICDELFMTRSFQ